MIPNTAVDIVVVLIILISAGLAFVRGFIRESLALGTWLLAIFLGFSQYHLLTPYLEDKISNPMLRDFAGGIGVFAIVMIVLIPVSFYIRSFIKGEHITAVDRSLGFVFGAGRGFLLLSIFYLIFSWLVPDQNQPEWMKEANTRPVLVYGAELIRDVIPKEQREMLEKKAKENKDKMEEYGVSKDDEATDNEEKPSITDQFDQILDGVKEAPK
jgi:membrane protein required for colicin V production